MTVRSLICALIACAAAGASAHTFSRSFTYFANGSDLQAVLSGFAQEQKLVPVFDGAVSGRISGNFRSIPAKAFLEAMKEAYGVGYYVLGDDIHFYGAKDLQKDFLTVRNGSGEDLIASLKNAGFIADELPLKLNDQGTLLTVSGPKAYVSQIRSAASAYEAVQTGKIVMRVFPVKHAWADDITLTSMDQTVTVPGIASILRGMVMGQSVGGQTVSQSREVARAQPVPGVGAEGLSKQSRTRERVAASSPSPVASGSISIMADPRVNAVLVSDAAYRMPYYEEVIRDLDKPVELVEIHAAIVDIDTSASRDLGISFSGTGSRGNNWQAGGTAGAANTSNQISTVSSTAGALLSTIYTHGSDFFMAKISAMESKNEARMLGRPSVLTVDNVQATLENTTTYYIPLRGTEAVDLYKVESGTVLRVTPHIIHEDGRTAIKLAVNVQDDQNNSSDGYQSAGDSVTVSPIKQTKINTQAIVGAGQSLLIGGYYYEQKSKGDSGVPLLKDIPWIGNLFKSTSKAGRLMERLILLTPRIVTPDSSFVPRRADEPTFAQKPDQDDYRLRNEAAEGSAQ